MRNKIFFMGLLLVLLILSGCGSKKEDKTEINFSEVFNNNEANFNNFINEFNITYRINPTRDKYDNKFQTMILNLRDSPINEGDDSSKIRFMLDFMDIPFLYLYENDENSDYYVTTWYVSKPYPDYKLPNRLERKQIITYLYSSNSINIKNFYERIITQSNFLGNLEHDVGIDYEYYDKILNITIDY